MAYDYLELTNSLNRKLNEVELTSSNFLTSVGFYSQIKDAVNYSIREINQDHYQWPFNHEETDQVLTAGQIKYEFPDDMKTVDFDSFRVRRDSALSNPVEEAKKLSSIDYDDWLLTYVDSADKAAADGAEPRLVIRTNNLEEWLIEPIPDQAYTITYEYWKFPVDLINATDVPTIPERFKHIIVDGAMYHAYMFRDNIEQAAVSKRQFEDGLKTMRSLLINRYETMRNTVRNPGGLRWFGIDFNKS